MSNSKDSWGSQMSRAFSAVGSFRAVLLTAMWNWHWCLTCSKHRCRQASAAFTRCHGNLSRPGPHVPATKFGLLCSGAPPASCSPRSSQWKKIRANCCCLLRRAPAFETLKELPGVSCMASMCLNQQPWCKCTCRPVWPKEPNRQFQIENYSLRLQQDFSNAWYFKHAFSVGQCHKTVTTWHLMHDWFVTEVAEWPNALIGSVLPSLPWRKGEHLSPERHGFIVHILLITQISDNRCTHVYMHFFSMPIVTLNFYTYTEKTAESQKCSTEK